jgi:hypothetical protein
MVRFYEGKRRRERERRGEDENRRRGGEEKGEDPGSLKIFSLCCLSPELCFLF